MPTRLVHLVVDAHDPAGLARFWASALDWVIADETTEEVDVWPAGDGYPDSLGVVTDSFCLGKGETPPWLLGKTTQRERLTSLR